MSAEVRKRAPFELLAFTAAPVAGALAVVELEGRFANARFTRQPVLVVESARERPRLEFAPVRSAVVHGHWRGSYAIPAEVLPDARFALGVRGTLLELPAPDEPDDAERLAALAREANALRRALEAAETAAATARAEAEATSADLGAAVLAARDGALAESTDRITALEAELVAATTVTREQTEAAHAAAAARAEEADARLRAAEEQAAGRIAEAEARARAAEDDADARARAAEGTAEATTSGIEVLRAELAEERERSAARIAELEAEVDAAQRRADALRNATAAERESGEDVTRPLATGDDPTTAVHLPFDRPSRPPPTVLDPVTPVSTHRTAARRGVGPWVAVAALLLFAFVLLGLLLGYLA